MNISLFSNLSAIYAASNGASYNGASSSGATSLSSLASALSSNAAPVASSADSSSVVQLADGTAITTVRAANTAIIAVSTTEPGSAGSVSSTVDVTA